MSQRHEVVISGVSGLYPAASSVQQLAHIIYNEENPFSDTSSRWVLDSPELPKYLGKAPNLERFDANFFTVNNRLGHHMDPMSRKLLEHTYQAIYDAGLHPGHFNGKKVAVFIGSSYSDTEQNGVWATECRTGMTIVGTSKTMFANRISYWLNVKGPSLSVDESDCSGVAALEQAVDAVRRGECVAAIVGSAHLCLQPQEVIHHARISPLCKDGKIKLFAENSNGFILSDAVNVLLLQKAEDALRNYARILHVKNEYVTVGKAGEAQSFGYTRDVESTAQFIRDFYREVAIAPELVEYVEAYGTGVPDADKCELQAIEEVYCKDRRNPLLVGSVTSNIGLTMAAAGITGITKVLLAYNRGELAPTAHCGPVRRDGRLRVVTSRGVAPGRLAALSCLSVTGCNGHVLLQGHHRHKDLSRYATTVPYLVPLSGRQEVNVTNIYADLKSRPVDAEEIALLHNIHCNKLSGHLSRGYIILGTNAEKQTTSLVEKTQYFDATQRPLWFVYSGMGSQWPGMGTQLMRIPIFASAIERCQRALSPMGVDVLDIITSTDKAIFDNILHSFVGIAAVQIGLTDILQALGLQPDGIIGHSVGELGCGYADGCLTADEMILAAYYRGLVSLETPLIRGAMAAVGMGYQQVAAACPPALDVSCHNSAHACTVSGPAAHVAHFVAQLAHRGVFAKLVPTSNIAYHSRYIAHAGPDLLKYLKRVLKNPKARSEHWLSTSVPQDEWHHSAAKFCSAEYHTNNLLSPVLFEETCQLIPSNAVLIEVAPHGLLQAILKRSLSECRNIPLTRRGHADNVVHLLQAVGDIYMEGFSLNTQALYPKVEFPVSIETPMLSHLVGWMHSETWDVVSYNVGNKRSAAILKLVKSVHDDEHKYLQGHVLRDKMCFPFAAALVSAWEMLAMHGGARQQDVSVMFEDVHLYAQPQLFDHKPLRLTVSLYRGSGRFEVRSENSKIASGYAIANYIERKKFKLSEKNISKNLAGKDIYQLLEDRGYKYSGEFRSIQWADAAITRAALAWTGNWVTFIDGLLQLDALRRAPHGPAQPAFIKSILIDVKEHVIRSLHDLNSTSTMAAYIEDDGDFTRCGGVTLRSIRYRKHLPKIEQDLLSHGLRLKACQGSSMIKKPSRDSQRDANQHVSLRCKEIGKLETLYWARSAHSIKLSNEVKVEFAGLSQFDVRHATGAVVSDNTKYGMDYSGLTRRGERVMGLVAGGAASSLVAAAAGAAGAAGAGLLWPVPRHWTLEDAATVPLAYAHAYYALVVKGDLQPGSAVLVHEAAEGGVGQAAIHLALAYRCRVFATVGDVKHKLLLQKLFPQLKEEHIQNYYDISFADYVLLATGGVGCDIILSCGKGELKDASIKCCGSSGSIIDICRIRDREEYIFGMNALDKCRSYISVDFRVIFLHENYKYVKVLQKLISDGIAAGYVVPLTRITYEAQEAERAFKLLEKNQHFGRVLLRIGDNTVHAQPRIILDPDQWQVILWNNEVCGVQVAEKLIEHGAKNLYIGCSTSTPYTSYNIRSWEKRDIKVVVAREQFTEDVFQTKVLTEGLRSLGTVEGVYVVLSTANNTGSKTDYVSALHNTELTSRLMCPHLKNFVIVSTIKDLGEKVCLSRFKRSLPATWLDLSSQSNIISNVGCDNLAALIDGALHSEYVMLVVEENQVESCGLFDQLISLADIKIPQHVDSSVTLQELNLAEEKIPLIRNLLNVKYHLYLEEREVPLLTLQQVSELERYATETPPINNVGLWTFVADSYSDEMLATADLIVLSTLSHTVASIDNDFGIKEQYLCVVPGVGGCYGRFQALCERLKVPALALQPALDHPHETAQQTAHRYANILMKRTYMKDNFYILGYESGVMVALELATILEEQGYTGTVFCLGSAPSEFQAEVQHQLREYVSDEQLQEAVIRHIYILVSAGDTKELDEKLRGLSSWTEKVDTCARLLLGRTTHSTQFVRALMQAVLARLVEARTNVVTTRPLRSKVVLLRAASVLDPPDETTLQQLSQQPVSMHQLRLPLSSVCSDMRCSALINQYLDESVLKAFENKNLCESYFIPSI